MKVIGLDGKIHSWNPLNCSNDFSNSSEYHKLAKSLLKKLFPCDEILEEVSLSGTKTRFNNMLRVDFYIPKKRMGIEVHGEQHYKFVPHFHASEKSFALSCMRDKNKLDWFNRNNMQLIVLPFDKTVEEWEKIVLKC